MCCVAVRVVSPAVGEIHTAVLAVFFVGCCPLRMLRIFGRPPARPVTNHVPCFAQGSTPVKRRAPLRTMTTVTLYRPRLNRLTLILLTWRIW